MGNRMRGMRRKGSECKEWNANAENLGGNTKYSKNQRGDARNRNGIE